MELISINGLFDVLMTNLPLADAAAGPETLKWWIDLVLHVDKKLDQVIKEYGLWTHLILFAVVFCETGLVFTPFLPGDSLLFAAGVFAAVGLLKIEWLIPLLIIAAILGDTVNYWMGKWIGERAFSGRIPFLKKEQLDATHAYFDRYGAKTVIIARFVPFIRTFAPFVAGIGSMNYRKFFVYNVIGGVVWVLLFLIPGYLLGSIPVIKDNFKLIVLGIIVISVSPMIYELWSYLSKRKPRET